MQKFLTSSSDTGNIFNPFNPACHLRDDIQNEKKSIFRSAVLSEDKYYMFDMTKRTRGLTNIKMAVIDIVYSHIFDNVFLFFIEKYSDSRSHILFSLLLLDCFYAKFFKTVWKTESWLSITSSTLINGHFSNFTHVTKYTSFLFVTI